MEESRVIKLKEQAKIAAVAIGAIGVVVGALAGSYIYSKGRDDQLTADAKSLYELEKAGVIKLKLPETTNSTT